MMSTDFAGVAGNGYLLEQGKRVKTAEDFLEYLYEQEQEQREHLLDHCMEDGEFRTWLRTQSSSPMVRKWEENLEGQKDRIRRYVELLCLLERMVPAKRRRILNLCSQLLRNTPEFWLIQHLELYRPSGPEGKALLEKKDDFTSGGGNGAEDFRELMNRMESWMEQIREHMLNNYILYERGFFIKKEYDLFSCHLDGYFVDDGSGKKVPIGYLKEKKQIQFRHLLEDGVTRQIKEAQASVEAFRRRLSAGIDRLETLQTEIRATYKRPGRIRSILGIGIGAAVAAYGILTLVSGVFEGMAWKILTGVMTVAALAALKEGSAGFIRCGKWKLLVRSIRELKDLDAQAESLEKYLKAEQDLWEQKGALVVKPVFPLERDKAILERMETLENGLKKKTRPLLWTLLALVLCFLVWAGETISVETISPAVANQLQVRTLEIVDWDSLEQVSASAEVSSSLISQSTGIVYGPERMLDGDINTSWQEGVEGYGEGETLLVSFYGETVPLKVISFYGGSFQSEEKFQENGRPAAITVICKEKDREVGSFQVELEDAMKANYLEWEQAIPCDALELRIDRIYPGSRYEDTAVTELAFYMEK